MNRRSQSAAVPIVPGLACDAGTGSTARPSRRTSGPQQVRAEEDHKRGHHTPAVSLMVQAVWASLLTLTGTYNQLLDYVIFAVLLFYILTILGLFRLRRTRPDAPRPYRAWGYPVVPVLYIVLALFIEWALLMNRPGRSLAGLGIVAVGIPIYYLWRRRNLPADR